MLKIYLETTIFNFPFANDAPQYRDATLMLWRQIEEGLFIPYTSTYVIDELLDAKDDLKQKRLDLIKRYDVAVFPKKDEIDRLALLYVKKRIIPKKYKMDATHIACCGYYNLDFVISLNFQHIVKRKTIIECKAVNTVLGYKAVGIYTPQEVIDYGKGL